MGAMFKSVGSQEFDSSVAAKFIVCDSVAIRQRDQCWQLVLFPRVGPESHLKKTLITQGKQEGVLNTSSAWDNEILDKYFW